MERVYFYHYRQEQFYLIDGLWMSDEGDLFYGLSNSGGFLHALPTEGYLTDEKAMWRELRAREAHHGQKL